MYQIANSTQVTTPNSQQTHVILAYKIKLLEPKFNIMGKDHENPFYVPPDEEVPLHIPLK